MMTVCLKTVFIVSWLYDNLLHRTDPDHRFVCYFTPHVFGPSVRSSVRPWVRLLKPARGTISLHLSRPYMSNFCRSISPRDIIARQKSIVYTTHPRIAWFSRAIFFRAIKSHDIKTRSICCDEIAGMLPYDWSIGLLTLPLSS